MIKMQNILTFYYEYQHIFILDFVLLLIDHWTRTLKSKRENND